MWSNQKKISSSYSIRQDHKEEVLSCEKIQEWLNKGSVSVIRIREVNVNDRLALMALWSDFLQAVAVNEVQLVQPTIQVAHFFADCLVRPDFPLKKLTVRKASQIAMACLAKAISDQRCSLTELVLHPHSLPSILLLGEQLTGQHPLKISIQHWSSKAYHGFLKAIKPDVQNQYFIEARELDYKRNTLPRVMPPVGPLNAMSHFPSLLALPSFVPSLAKVDAAGDSRRQELTPAGGKPPLAALAYLLPALKVSPIATVTLRVENVLPQSPVYSNSHQG